MDYSSYSGKQLNIRPQKFVATNVLRTATVLHAAASNSCMEAVRLPSSGKVCASARSISADEGHALHAPSPFAAMKIAADALAIRVHRLLADGLRHTVERVGAHQKLSRLAAYSA